MIEINDITYAYGEVKALHGISLKANPGKITCITGRNGVGKTTLMKNIMGTLPAKSGSILLDGKDITKRNAWARARQGIALVPQGRHIFPKLSVVENLMVGLEANPDTKTIIPEEIY
ncbi:MAG: ATP-binding cassette domain-containing protein, partial [Fibrobacterales bacterium]